VGTITIRTEIEIDRPAAEAWAVVADYDHDPAWRAGVATMAPDPPGIVQAGTTTAEELRFAGQTRRNRGEVTAVDPGRSFRWRTVEGDDAEGGRSVEPLGPDRCLVRLELDVRPTGIERVLAPVLGPLLRRTVRRDAARLRTMLEAPSRSGLGASATG
jgi:uncharacterized membrane protein